MFFFKPKKIHVDCFVTDSSIANQNPIKKARHFIPDWWKKLKPTYESRTENGIKVDFPTVKTCAGFSDLYQQGLIMPLWSDLVIEIAQEAYRYSFAFCPISKRTNNKSQGIETHSVEQYGNAFSNHVHMKIISPWLLREKTGVNFMFTGCVWTTTRAVPKMTVLNGVVNYKHQHGTNINSFFSLENTPYQTEIESGTPLVQIIPISEKKVEPHIQLVDQVEYNKIADSVTIHKFKGSYAAKFKSKVVP